MADKNNEAAVNKIDNGTTISANSALTVIETSLARVPASTDDPTIKSVALALSHRPKYLLKICTDYGITGGELNKIMDLVKSHDTDITTIVKYCRGEDYSLEQVGCALAIRDLCLDSEDVRIFTLIIILRYLRSFHSEDGLEAVEIYDELQQYSITDDDTLRAVVRAAEKHDIKYVEVASRYGKSGKPILNDPLGIGGRYNVVEGQYDDDDE